MNWICSGLLYQVDQKRPRKDEAFSCFIVRYLLKEASLRQ